ATRRALAGLGLAEGGAVGLGVARGVALDARAARRRRAARSRRTRRARAARVGVEVGVLAAGLGVLVARRPLAAPAATGFARVAVEDLDRVRLLLQGRAQRPVRFARHRLDP